MAFQAADFLTLADELATHGESQAHIRTAISRAYFSGHLVAVSRMTKKGWEPSGRGDDHGKVLFEMRTRRYRDAADMLAKLRKYREHADYHVERVEPLCAWCARRTYPEGTIPDLSQADWTEVRAVAHRAMKLLATI